MVSKVEVKEHVNMQHEPC